MGYFIVQASLFVAGFVIIAFGTFPVSRRRWVSGSAAYLIGVLLLAPLPVYVAACSRSHVALMGSERSITDPILQVTEGYVRLFGLAVALGFLLLATVLAIISSEPRRRL